MPVVSLCPRCRAVLPGTGGTERCRRCGENVVAVQRAFCSRCGQDISASARIESSPGEFYCEACWADNRSAAGRAVLYPCSWCGNWFPVEHVYARGTRYICKRCEVNRRAVRGPQPEPGMTELDPNALLAVAAEAAGGEPVKFQPVPDSFNEFKSRIWWAQHRRLFIRIGVAFAVAVVLTFAWVWWTGR